MSETVAAIFAGVWADQASLSTIGHLTNMLAAEGIDPAPVVAGIDGRERDRHLTETTRAAGERGVFGVPTFIVGDQMFFGNDRLDFLREYLERRW